MNKLKDSQKYKKLITLSFIISFSFIFFISFASALWVQKPQVITLEPEIIGNDFIVMRGNVTNIGIPSGYLNAYFEFQEVGGNYFSTATQNIIQTGEYSQYVGFLKENTQYRYRARYVNDSILYYGAWKYFETEEIKPLGNETAIDYSETIYFIEGDYFTKSQDNKIAYISIFGSGDDSIYYYNVNTAPNLSSYIQIDERPILKYLTYSPVGNYIAYYREDTKDVLVKHTNDIGTPYYSYSFSSTGFADEVYNLKYSGCGNYLYIHFYNEMEDEDTIWALTQSSSFETGLQVISEDNFFYGLAVSESYISYWDYNNEQIRVRTTPSGYTFEISFSTSSNTLYGDKIAFSPNEKYFGYVENVQDSEILRLRNDTDNPNVWGSSEVALYSYNLTELTGVKANENRVRHLKFSYDNNYLTFAQGNKLHFFDLETGEIFFDINISESQYIVDYEVDNFNKQVYISGYAGEFDLDLYRFELGIEVTGFEEPIVYTNEVDNILRESARFNADILYLAGYENISLYFEFEEIDGDGFSTFPTQTITTGGTYSKEVAFLSPNTQYRVRAILNYNETEYIYSNWVFFITLSEDVGLEEESDSITNIAEYLYSLFPDPDDLTSRQKVFFVVLSMIIVSSFIIAVSVTNYGINSFILYLIGLINFIIFFFFMFIGYISYLVLVIPLLIVISLVLIKFIK